MGFPQTSAHRPGLIGQLSATLLLALLSGCASTGMDEVRTSWKEDGQGVDLAEVGGSTEESSEGLSASADDGSFTLDRIRKENELEVLLLFLEAGVLTEKEYEVRRKLLDAVSSEPSRRVIEPEEAEVQPEVPKVPENPKEREPDSDPPPDTGVNPEVRDRDEPEASTVSDVQENPLGKVLLLLLLVYMVTQTSWGPAY